MKWTTALLTALFCLLCIGAASAKEQSLYFNLGLSKASPTYPDGVEELLDLIEELPDVDRIQLGLDLGLYFPMGKTGLLGPAITVIGDRLDDGDDHMQFNQVLYAASFRYYFSGERAKGLFLRGDLGFARGVLDMSGADTETSDWGQGFLVGGGYSFQIGGGTWLSLSAEYTSKSIEDETYGGTTVGIAFLF